MWNYKWKACKQLISRLLPTLKKGFEINLLYFSTFSSLWGSTHIWKKNSDVFGFWGKSPHITIFRILAHCVRCWFGPETFRLDVSKRYHDKLRYYLMALLVSKLASLFSRRWQFLTRLYPRWINTFCFKEIQTKSSV